MQSRKLLSLREAAKILGITSVTLAHWTEKGFVVGGYKVGRGYAFEPDFKVKRAVLKASDDLIRRLA
jgi:predicted site-specific integrase-resolvase